MGKPAISIQMNIPPLVIRLSSSEKPKNQPTPAGTSHGDHVTLIEDCPLFQSLREEHLPESLQHLHIHGCPLLREQCHQMKNRGDDPQVVANMHILDMDFDLKSIPDSGRHMAAPSPSDWYHPLICCKAMEHESDMEPAQSSNSAETSKKIWKKGAAADLNNEVFVEHMRMKKWVGKNSGKIIYMLYARSLFITWVDNKEYWTWNCFKETSDENIEVAKLLTVCWLDVRGKFKTSELSTGVGNFFQLFLPLWSRLANGVSRSFASEKASGCTA